MDPERELGEQGLSEAMDRLRERLKGGERYQVPFTEALFWITALKDVAKIKVDYTITDGERLKALGWARNFAAHKLLTPATVNMASSGLLGVGLLGVSLLGGPGTLVWVGEAALPPQPHEGDRRALYQTLESARESWRLLPLRGWSNAKEIPLSPRGA